MVQLADNDDEETVQKVDPAELEGLVRIMTPYDPTVDQCRDYLIYISYLGEMERTGRDTSGLSIWSEDFLRIKKRMKKDTPGWKALRNSGRELLKRIRVLNASPIPDIFKALESRDEEVRKVISIRMLLRKFFDTSMSPTSSDRTDQDPSDIADDE